MTVSGIWMEGTLPNSLKHIISNAEYYGASLFLLAIDVVTVYAFQEPSLLSSLQGQRGDGRGAARAHRQGGAGHA